MEFRWRPIRAIHQFLANIRAKYPNANIRRCGHRGIGSAQTQAAVSARNTRPGSRCITWIRRAGAELGADWNEWSASQCGRPIKADCSVLQPILEPYLGAKLAMALISSSTEIAVCIAMRKGKAPQMELRSAIHYNVATINDGGTNLGGGQGKITEYRVERCGFVNGQ